MDVCIFRIGDFDHLQPNALEKDAPLLFEPTNLVGRAVNVPTSGSWTIFDEAPPKLKPLNEQPTNGNLGRTQGDPLDPKLLPEKDA